jgi:hypothetical protein
MIDRDYPGTKLALTEYTYGAGDHISGGVAEADALGIFGREGLFAAAWWDTGTGSKYVNAALDAYLNFDGKGGHFGDTSLSATTDDVAAATIYASVDRDDASRMVLVLVNRSDAAVTADVTLVGTPGASNATLYRFDASAPAVRRAGEVKSTGGRLTCDLPSMSVTTAVLTRRP